MISLHVSSRYLSCSAMSYTQFYTISRSPNQAPSQKGSSDRGTFSCRSPATASRSSCTIGAAPFAVLAPLAASTSAPGDFSFPPLRPLATPLIDSSCTSLAWSGRRVKRFQNLHTRLGQHMKRDEYDSHCRPQHCLIDQMGQSPAMRHLVSGMRQTSWNAPAVHKEEGPGLCYKQLLRKA